jgi:murein DD-endopeptidase MepM/ murein hydrolase activator NlpD
MMWNDFAYECTPKPQTPQPNPWSFPVGNGQYPPEMWYAASLHDLTGKLNNGYKHTGIDLNLAMHEFGDVERRLGLSVYAVADGVVTYVTENWSGAPMIVILHENGGDPLWVRYAHITPVVMQGQSVKAGQALGGFADWKTGDHLHFDMATEQFTREWLTRGINWIDPVPVLKAHLDPKRVDAMLER